MAEAARARPWAGRAIYAALIAVLIFAMLLPLDTVPPDLSATELLVPAPGAGPGDGTRMVDLQAIEPRRWVMPDLILAVTVVWVSRRPDHVPAVVVVAVMLLTDLLFQRPPGLWAALVLVLTEMLRARSAGMRTMPPAVEWMSLSFGIVAITLAYRAILSVLAVPQAAFSLVLGQLLVTCLCLPLVAFLAHILLGVGRPAPGEVDSLGHRL